MKKIFNIISVLMIICVVGFASLVFSVGMFVDSVRENTTGNFIIWFIFMAIQISMCFLCAVICKKGNAINKKIKEEKAAKNEGEKKGQPIKQEDKIMSEVTKGEKIYVKFFTAFIAILFMLYELRVIYISNYKYVLDIVKNKNTMWTSERNPTMSDFNFFCITELIIPVVLTAAMGHFNDKIFKIMAGATIVSCIFRIVVYYAWLNCFY
jgi:hypothetical protein